MDWLGRVRGAAAPNVYDIASRTDPWLVTHDRFADPETWNQLFLGVDAAASILTTAPRTHALVLGPPQSLKSAGELVPMILFANGPTVATSTKEDIYRATAMARSRKGDLWHFAPDGSPPLPGTIPLHWSPIGPSKDWATALMLGKLMAEAADVAGGTNESAFFRQKAGEMVASLLHGAGLAGKPMEWVLEAVAENDRNLRDAESIMRSTGGYSNIGADALAGIMRLDGRSRGSIIATTSNAFSAYRLPGALEVTRNPNFDEHAFVAGQPDVVNPGLFGRLQWAGGNPGSAFGRYDTLYITASAQAQAFVAPLVVALLSRIRQARYDIHRHDQMYSYERPPAFFALDEVANIAPLPELPSILAEGSSQGVLTCCVMQDLSQAKVRWKDHHEGFPTLFREVVAFPGIRNPETLEQLSQLSGDVWEEQFGSSANWNKHSKRRGDWSAGESVSEQRRARYSPPEIYRGASEDEDPAALDPRRMLVMDSTGKTDWAFSAPYFFSPPLAEALVGVVENIVTHATRGAWSLMLPPPDLRPEMMATPGIDRRWNAALQRLHELVRE